MKSKEELEELGKKILQLENAYSKRVGPSDIESQITQLVSFLSFEDMIFLDEFISNHIENIKNF